MYEYVTERGFYTMARMASDIISRGIKREWQNSFHSNLEINGSHLGSFRLFSTFKTKERSIYEPVEIFFDISGLEYNQVDPKETFETFTKIFESESFYLSTLNNVWISYNGFSDNGFDFRVTTNFDYPDFEEDYILIKVIPALSRLNLDNMYKNSKIGLGGKRYQNPILDYSPYRSFVLDVDPSSDPIYTWKLDWSLGFLIWFENETRDGICSFLRGYQFMNYSPRSFRYAVMMSIFIKVHLIKYKPELYSSQTMLLILFLCGRAYAETKPGKVSNLGNELSRFREFVLEARKLIKPQNSKKDIWWLSHPCDESINLLETWNMDEILSNKFFQWLDFLNKHFSESRFQKSKLNADDYLKNIFLFNLDLIP
ncbi:hypothetical protein GCM10027164_04940 [Algoriphagus taiwanensis]